LPVHAARRSLLNLPPARFTNQAFGYVSFDTTERWGFPRQYTSLSITVAENKDDAEHIQTVTDQVKDKLHGFDYFMARLDYGFDRREKLNERTCQITNKQIGNIRVNCMDCLDRTNVV
jgi:hypothetical protein